MCRPPEPLRSALCPMHTVGFGVSPPAHMIAEGDTIPGNMRSLGCSPCFASPAPSNFVPNCPPLAPSTALSSTLSMRWGCAETLEGRDSLPSVLGFVGFEVDGPGVSPLPPVAATKIGGRVGSEGGRTLPRALHVCRSGASTATCRK